MASNRKRERLVALAAYFLVFAVSLALLEGMCRLAVSNSELLLQLAQQLSVGSELKLDKYEIVADDAPQHWRLKPGYESDVKAVARQKIQQGKVLSAEALIEQGDLVNIPARGVLRVNSAGFKGPELATDKVGKRIVVIGDSTTFGFGPFDYPAAMRWEFARRGMDVEVVNAGVEGYSTRNVLHELDRIAAIRPDTAVIYIGWNDLYLDEGAYCVVCRYSSIARLAVKISKRFQTKDLTKSGVADPNDPKLSRLDGFQPAAMSNVREIIHRLLAVNVQPVLVTLAGLYDTGLENKPKVGGVAPLPLFIDNPVFFAKLAGLYNQELRRLAAEENIPLLDAEKWSRDALQPRFEYFTDGTHMDARALSKLGIFIARNLIGDGKG